MMHRRGEGCHALFCSMRWRGGFLALALSAAVMVARAQCPGIAPSFTWVSEDNAVHFTDVTDTYGLPVTSRWWEFGDGYYGGAIDTAITYATTDVDSVKLHLWVAGCEFTVGARVAHGDANDFCTASIAPGFSWYQPANNQVSFSNTTVATGVDLAGLWEFGDYQLDLGPAPTHTYLYPGYYPAGLSLAGTDTSTGDGCVAGMVQWVGVDGNASTCDTSLFLDFSYSFDGVYAQFNSVVDIYSTTLEVTLSEWDMGDGTATITSEPSPYHTFSPDGHHQVCLTVSALDTVALEDCSAVVCHTLEVNAVSVPENWPARRAGSMAQSL